MDRNGFRLQGARHGRRCRRPGFTLLEAIVAIVMFTFIMLAVSQAIQMGLQSMARGQSRETDDGSVRAVFDVITKDILAAYASPNSPTSVFTTTGAGGNSSSGSLLMFTALSTRLQLPELDAQNGTGSTLDANATSQPQSDMSFVTYNFDSSSGTLYRVVNIVPSAQNTTPPAPTPDQAIAKNISNIQLSFWDETQGTWRTDWDYEQQNQIGVIPLSTGTTSTTPGAPAGASSTPTGSSGGTPNTTLTGDSYLPGAVKVTLTLQLSNGQTQDFVTSIPLGASQTYLNPNQTANVNTYPPTTAGTTTATSGP